MRMLRRKINLPPAENHLPLVKSLVIVGDYVIIEANYMIVGVDYIIIVDD